jgi:NADPH:quinone reductase-like Zn-dependent oxidoreductase
VAKSITTAAGALAHLVDAVWLRPIVSQVLPLAEARAAYTQGLAGHNRGKPVLSVA